MLFTAGIAAYPLTAMAQDAGKRQRIALLTGNIEGDAAAQSRVQAFKQGLLSLGWRENENIGIDVRWPGPSVQHQQKHARELVALSPDVILATSTRTARALQDATGAIPIIFVGLSDPVATGVVSNLARPEANITGFALYEHSLSGKWLSLLKDLAPQLTHVAVLFNPDTSPYAHFYADFAQETGTRLGLRVTSVSIKLPDEIEGAIEKIGRSGTSGFIAIPDGGFIAANNQAIITCAAKYRVPAIYAVNSYAANGGLMAYSADLASQFRDGATYVDRVLRGVKPEELPVQFATRFELVINSKAASALGLNIPQHLLVDAEIIE
jgi:putative ABC transport system substrate-binding protein